MPEKRLSQKHTLNDAHTLNDFDFQLSTATLFHNEFYYELGMWYLQVQGYIAYSFIHLLYEMNIFLFLIFYCIFLTIKNNFPHPPS